VTEGISFSNVAGTESSCLFFDGMVGCAKRRQQSNISEFRLLGKEILPQVLRGLHVFQNSGNETTLTGLRSARLVRVDQNLIDTKDGGSSRYIADLNGLLCQVPVHVNERSRNGD
jgi:hypothetical protein